MLYSLEKLEGREFITYCLSDGFSFSFGMVVKSEGKYKFTVYPTECLSYDLQSDVRNVTGTNITNIFQALVYWVSLWTRNPW
ncbi:hypothetical protein AN958_05718 [Leucoagaricus sp. SymC.cos]|nr:hypothetical protein AN958_05718 [Leucoagaricus sp. SymC.cos]